MKRWLIWGLLATVFSNSAVCDISGDSRATEVLQIAIAAFCKDAKLPVNSPEFLAKARILKQGPISESGGPVGWTTDLALPDGAILKIMRIAPDGVVRRIVTDYYAPTPRGPRAILSAAANSNCQLVEGRRIVYDGRGAPVSIEYLDSKLALTGRHDPVNPPVPTGTDPAGVSVALIDSGVNYLLPAIAHALARDVQGRILGFDFWDMDDRPFDADILLSPFAPRRHGTQVAGVLLSEAPQIRILPYRYPGFQPARMEDLIRDLVGKGVVIVNIAITSPDERRWNPFYKAALAHPQVLFVVASGNEGWNIDERPVYPTAYELPNMVTVAAADSGGQISPHSNWGAVHVDFAVRAEGIRTLDFDGRSILVGGSSFASARLTALVARLLAIHPGWKAPELKAALVQRAHSMDSHRRVRYGLLADPLVP